MNFAHWLLRAATRTPNAEALWKGDRPVATYAEFAQSAAGIAAALCARGVSKGDRVGIYASNRTEYLEALFGIWWIGATVVPINSKLHVKEAAWILSHAEAKLVFTAGDVAASLSQADIPSRPEILSLDGPDFSKIRAVPPLARPVDMADDDLAWLFYTSGTTGKPKGVALTCGNIVAMALCYFVDVDTVTAKDAALYAAPMSHGAGLYCFMFVMRGARHVVPESGGFHAAEVLDLAAKIGEVSMFAAPTMVRRLVDTAKQTGVTGHGLKTVVYAGGPMYLVDIIEAVDVLGPRFVQIYGQGECPMAITVLSREDVADRTHPRWRERLASVGTAQSAVQVRVVDQSGADVLQGGLGEIVVKGTPVMSGYWKNAEATAQTLRDSWLWTGDVGKIDEDGYVTLQDRSKDVIISGGSNIYPREVEEALLTHHDVREAAVVGQSDPEWGEVIVAFIVPEPGQQITPQALDAHCLSQIARFKRPKRYRVIDALPKNNYGKVLKTELRSMLLSKGDRNG